LSRRNESLIPKVLTKRFSEKLQKKKRQRKRRFFGFLYPNTIKEKINPVKENRVGRREGWIDRSRAGGSKLHFFLTWIDRSRPGGSELHLADDLDRSVPSWDRSVPSWDRSIPSWRVRTFISIAVFGPNEPDKSRKYPHPA